MVCGDDGSAASHLDAGIMFHPVNIQLRPGRRLVAGIHSMHLNCKGHNWNLRHGRCVERAPTCRLHAGAERIKKDAVA